MSTAIIYVRVSSHTQINNTSLETQEQLCREYCEREGMEVDKVFIEKGESARYIDRTELQASIAYCGTKQVDFFIVWRLDRFSRSAENHYKIRSLLTDLGVRVISVSEPVEDSPEGRFVEGIFALKAQLENEQRWIKVEHGIKARLQQGYWLSNQPPGYIRAKEFVYKRCRELIRDPDRWPWIKRAWDLMVTGSYSIADIVKFLNDNNYRTRTGGKAYKQMVSSMFRNKLYLGMIDVPKYGILVKAKHEAMIDQKTFDQVQDVLAGKAPHLGRKQDEYNKGFALVKALKCHCCGRMLSGYHAKGNGGLYGYYRCTNSKCAEKPNYKQKDVESAAFNLIASIEPTSELLSDFEFRTKQLLSRQKEEITNGQEQLKREITSANNKLEKLKDLLEGGAYTIDEYNLRTRSLKQEIVIKESMLSDVNIDAAAIEEKVHYCVEFMVNFSNSWKNLTSREKAAIFKHLWPELVTYPEIKARTLPIPPLFKTIGGATASVDMNGGESISILEPILQFYDVIVNLNKLSWLSE